ncbi:hypothetical protein [Candidatus Avelusimicrobium sp.]
MNIKWKSFSVKRIIEFFITSIISGFIGCWIGIYMNRPDISYYVRINQPAEISVDNSRRILKFLHSRRRNLRWANTYSSSVYISNTGYRAYKGTDFSRTKEPLRIETDSPIELFTIDDKKSSETTVSIKGEKGVYYIEFDFLNYGKSIRFVFTHQRPLKYLNIKGAGVDLPYIKEKSPLRIWFYQNFFLVVFILVIVSILFYYNTSKFDKEYYRLLQQFSVAKNNKAKKEIIKQIGILFEKNMEKHDKK